MKRAISIAVVMLLSVGFLAVPVYGSADKPTWTVSEKWAMGMESGAPRQTDIDAMEESFKMLFNLSDISIDVSGGGGVWMTFEVTDVSDSEYTLHYSMAVRNSVEEDFQFSAMMPEPGTYTPETFREAPKTLKEMSARLSTKMYVVASGDATIDRESMGVKSVSFDMEEKFEMSFTGKNLPSVDEFGIFRYSQLAVYYPEYEPEYDGYYVDENYTLEELDYNYTEANYTYSPAPIYPLTSTSHTLSYEDVDIEVMQTLNLHLTVNYDPPAAFIDFPLMEGKTWTVESHETVTGTYSGIIDAEGLPPMMEAGMLLGTGQSFPIKIEKINTYSPDFNNGVINHSGPLWMNMSCPDTMQIKDENGDYIQVYKIRQMPGYYEYYPGPDLYILYSPDKGFLAGVYIPSHEENLMPGMPATGSADIYGSFGALSSSLAAPYGNADTLEYVDYDYANKEILATSQEMKGTTGGEDYLGSALVFIILGVIIASAVIISMIALGRRKRAVPAYIPAEEVQQSPDIPETGKPPEF